MGTVGAGMAQAGQAFEFPAEWLPADVAIRPGVPPGLIQVDTASLWVYLTLEDGLARRYKCAVGATGRNFSGRARVGRKAEWPSWTPTASMIREEPAIYARYAGGLPGGHEMNPMGARALYLYQGSHDTMFRIHGTPQPWTVGLSFGSGCIRMLNDHAIDLYDRVAVGAEVVVV
ncbi:MAG: L,D-transpeptidase [Rubellimicrobium sp.]|nr:L,D-transpeptidase [Rubellimicrobium sp.]